MAYIDPEGIRLGRRLSRCSDEARLHWNMMYTCSNGYHRLELDGETIRKTIYATFNQPPTDRQLAAWIGEFYLERLAFLYQDPMGRWWLQFESKYSKQFKTATDKRSPFPDEQERTKWLLCQGVDQAVFTKFKSFFTGEGVGVGVGLTTLHKNRVESCSSAKTADEALPFDTPDSVESPNPEDYEGEGEATRKQDLGAAGLGLFDTGSPVYTNRRDQIAPAKIPADFEGSGKKRRKKVRGVEPEDFESFWQLYPRKVGKKPTKSAYLRVRQTHSFATVVTGLRKWIAYWDEPEFIPYPKTFLDQERFLDEPPIRGRHGRADSPQREIDMGEAMDAYTKPRAAE